MLRRLNMIKVKVIKPFNDRKENKKKRKVNEIIEVDQTRFKELRTSHRGPFVVKLKQEGKSNK